MTINLPENADLETCIDDCLKEVCGALQRRDLPDDIRRTLCGAASVLAVTLAFLPKDQRHIRIKKCRVARCRKVM